MFPFYYSTLNYDLIQSTPSGSLNILWNQLMQKSMTDSIMYMTPIFDFSIGYKYPEFGIYGNSLLDPMLAIQQTMQAFKNGGLMNNPFNNQMLTGPGQFTWPWQTPGGNQVNDGDTGNSREYDALRALIIKYKEIGTEEGNESISPDLLDRIDKALNKSGTSEEKIEALKDLYNQLNKDKLKKALLELPEYREDLELAGYKLNSTDKERKERETDLNRNLNRMERELRAKKVDTLLLVADSKNSSEILKLISHWNDTRSTDEDRGIIRLVAKNLPAAEDITNYKTGVNYLAESLMNKADDFKAETEGDFANLDKATNAVSEALAVANKDFTETNLMTLADKFDTLYAMLRMLEAEKIRNTINTKYGFLNDISSTDKDIADDKLILDETQADLKKEGISVANIKVDLIPKDDDEDIDDIDGNFEKAEDKIEALKNKKVLDKTDMDGVYATTSTSEYEPAKLYMVKDDKLVELKGAKAVDKDGNCIMTDGGTKAINDVETVEVNAQDVINYNNTLKRVNLLVGDGTIKPVDTSKMNNWPKNVKLYESKGNKEDSKKQYFVVKDNELMQIDCTGINPSGTFVINGKSVSFDKLTADNFSTVSNSDILTTDKKKEADEAAAAAKKQKEKELYEKAYKPLPMNENDVKTANDIAKDLMGNTNDQEWSNASGKIKCITKENVHTVISQYSKNESWGTDNILEQIATEQECKGWFGSEWGQERRNAAERLSLINHIVKTVLEHCETYGIKDKYAYTKLKEKYNNGKGITAADIDENAETTIRQLDKYILDLVKDDVNIAS